jgi:hypothetical protein
MPIATLTMLQRAADVAERAGRQMSAIAEARVLLRDGLVQVTEATGERSILWEDAKDRSTADRVRLSAIRLLKCGIEDAAMQDVHYVLFLRSESCHGHSILSVGRVARYERTSTR